MYISLSRSRCASLLYQLYLCQWCTVLCHPHAVPVCCINCICVSDVQFCFTHVLCQSAVSIVFVPVMYISVSCTRCASMLYELYLCQWCTFLCHVRALPVCCINYHSVPVLLSCLSSTGCTGALERTLQQALQMAVRKNISLPRSDQLRPTCNNTWQTFKCPYRLLTYQQQLTACGMLGDTIKGPDRTALCI